MLDKLYPCRAAGCEKGKGNRGISRKISLDSLLELRSFLHNSKVCRPVCIKDSIKPETPEGCGDLFLNICTRSKAKLLPYGNSHCRGDLNNNFFTLVLKCLYHIPGIVSFMKSSNGTYSYTLTAVGTNSLSQVRLMGCGYNSFETSVYSRKNSTGLDLITHGFTSTAHDALVHIPYYRGRKLRLKCRHISAVLYLLHLKVVGQIL